MNEVTQRRCKTIAMAAAFLCLLVMLERPGYAQVATSAPSAAQPAPPLCKDGVSPGVIQLTPDSNNPNKLALARKHFYLSSVPFNLVNNVNLKTAPSLRNFYNSVGASTHLIEWLEENNCETIYCRELTEAEVKCDGADPKKCVPEFVNAYRNALAGLNGNQELARKWITNYEPLSSPGLRVDFYQARTAWLKGALEAIEKKLENGNRIRSTISDKDGIAFFYDLCPGSYYIASIAPIDIQGSGIFWETLQPIKVEGPPDVNKAVLVTLAFPPDKNKRKNFFVGKLVAEVSQ